MLLDHPELLLELVGFLLSALLVHIEFEAVINLNPKVFIRAGKWEAKSVAFSFCLSSINSNFHDSGFLLINCKGSFIATFSEQLQQLI